MAMIIHEKKCKGPGTMSEDSVALRNKRREDRENARAKAKGKAKARPKKLGKSANSERRKTNLKARVAKARTEAERAGLSRAETKKKLAKAKVM